MPPIRNIIRDHGAALATLVAIPTFFISAIVLTAGRPSDCSEPVTLVGLVTGIGHSTADGLEAILVNVTEASPRAEATFGQETQVLVNAASRSQRATVFEDSPEPWTMADLYEDQPIRIVAVPQESNFGRALIDSCEPVSSTTVFKAVRMALLPTGD